MHCISKYTVRKAIGKKRTGVYVTKASQQSLPEGNLAKTIVICLRSYLALLHSYSPVTRSNSPQRIEAVLHGLSQKAPVIAQNKYPVTGTSWPSNKIVVGNGKLAPKPAIASTAARLDAGRAPSDSPFPCDINAHFLCELFVKGRVISANMLRINQNSFPCSKITGSQTRSL